MESRAKLFGHPIHQMLIVFPLGLLVTSVIFDVIYLLTGNELLPNVAYYLISAGLIGGLAAAVFGFIDYLAIPNGTRAKRVGTWHGFGNLVVVLFFFFSWLIRRNIPGYLPDWLALLASFAGLGVGTLTAWLGGELVNRLAVGVDPGANLNAPSSLSGRPANDTDTLPAHAQAVPVTGEMVEDPIREHMEVPTGDERTIDEVIEEIDEEHPPREKPLADEP